MALYSDACRFSQGELNGWKTLTLENELLRVTLLPEKGSDIIEFRYKPLDLEYLWKSPFGLPQKPNTDRLPHNGFMDYYEGGWEEIFPSGGEPNTYAGVEWGQHGELWSLPCEVSIDEYRPGQVTVHLECRMTKLPLRLNKTLFIRQNEPILHIEETVTNESDQPVEFMWGHHPAVGAPFMNGDCILDIPGNKCEGASVKDNPAARLGYRTQYDYPITTDKNGKPIDLSIVPPPSSKQSDEFWLSGLTEGWCALTDTKRKVGFGLAWDLSVFSSLWIWEEFGGTADEPWNNECYVMGIEPWSSYALEGLAEAARRNTQLTLLAHGTKTSWLKAIAYEGTSRVARIDENGTVFPAG